MFMKGSATKEETTMTIRRMDCVGAVVDLDPRSRPSTEPFNAGENRKPICKDPIVRAHR